MNPYIPGYGPGELPGCSTPQRATFFQRDERPIGELNSDFRLERPMSCPLDEWALGGAAAGPAECVALETTVCGVRQML